MNKSKRRMLAKDDITLEEVLEVLQFERDADGKLRVITLVCDADLIIGDVGCIKGNVGDVLGTIERDVVGNVKGSVRGSVWGDVWDDVWGDVKGVSIGMRRQVRALHVELKERHRNDS